MLRDERERRRRSARAAGKVSLAVLISRLLGLARDQVFAFRFGAGFYNDAWLVAFRIPNLLRDLFAEGAFSSAFVPTFTETLRKQGREKAWLLANLVLSALMLILAGVALLSILFSKQLVYLFAAGFGEVEGKVAVTARLIELLAPFLLLVAMASVAMGMLNTLNHFFLPALAPAFFNLALIGAGLLLAPRFSQWGWLPIYAMGVGALLGGMLQFGVQAPLLFREGFRFHFRLDFQHPGVRRIIRLMTPAVVGVSAVQLNVLVNTLLASFLADNGPVSWITYAFRILYLPIGLFGVAVGVVNLRNVSLHVARQDWTLLRETVASSLRLVTFLAVPSAVGLILLSRPIVRVLFERGEFSPLDTSHTADALICYALGLVAYSLVKVYVPTFYALEDTRSPVRISLLAVGVNILVNLILVFLLLPRWWPGKEFAGLALGTSIAVSLNAWLLARRFRERAGSLSAYAPGQALRQSLLSALLMALFLVLLEGLVGGWGGEGLEGQVFRLALSLAGGAGVYLLCCRLQGMEEVSFLLSRGKR